MADCLIFEMKSWSLQKSETKTNEGNSQQPLRDKLSRALFVIWSNENVSSQRQHYCVCKILEKWVVKCDIWNNSCKEYNELDSVCLRPGIRTSGDELLLTLMFQGTLSGQILRDGNGKLRSKIALKGIKILKICCFKWTINL